MGQASGPVPLHRRTHPNLDVEGCFGCKAASVSFGGVHRLRKQREDNVSTEQFKQEIYREARRTGRDIKRAGVTSPSSGGLI